MTALEERASRRPIRRSAVLDTADVHHVIQGRRPPKGFVGFFGIYPHATEWL